MVVSRRERFLSRALKDEATEQKGASGQEVGEKRCRVWKAQ